MQLALAGDTMLGRQVGERLTRVEPEALVAAHLAARTRAADLFTTDPFLRNDRGLLWFVTLQDARPVWVDAVPIALDHCHTRLAAPDEAAWIADRFAAACAGLGTQVQIGDGGERLRVRA